jgi:hypothetical protein
MSTNCPLGHFGETHRRVGLGGGQWVATINGCLGWRSVRLPSGCHIGVRTACRWTRRWIRLLLPIWRQAFQLGSSARTRDVATIRAGTGRRRWVSSSPTSRLELARIILADFDPRVLAIAAQPFRLVGPDGSRIRRHVPDLLLVDVDGAVTVVDVKSPHKRTDGSVQALMAWTDRIVALRGWALEAWYEAPHCLLTNVTFLAGYRRRSVVDATLFPAIRSAVGDGRSIAEVERVIGFERVASVRPAILHLLWSGELVTDLTRPLCGASVVRIAAGGMR